MGRRTGAAILICAVMVLVAAIPTVLAETHTISKGAQGPNASAVMWDYVPTDYGTWTGHIVNYGLRWVVVDIYDNSTGMLVNVMHQRIRFAAYDAYPSGSLNTSSWIMGKGHAYAIEITPNGPRGTYCTVEDLFDIAPVGTNPVALFTPTMDKMTVSVDATASYDPDIGGTIASYDWNFGDGSVGTGMVTTHTYGLAGPYTITLVVTDNTGLTGTVSHEVVAVMPGGNPIAVIAYTTTNLVVYVDGTGSYDPDGRPLVSYSWDFGDGTVLSGAIVNHTYATQGEWWVTLTVTDDEALTGSAMVKVAVSPGGIPPPPETVFGYVKDTSGAAVLGASAVVTDLRTGAVWTFVDVDMLGFYQVDLNTNATAWALGDTVSVLVTFGSLTGTGSGVILDIYLQIDIILA